MLLLMIERGLPIHAVLTADTGMEFPEMYEHLQKAGRLSVYRARAASDVAAPPKGGFEWLMFEEKSSDRPALKTGSGWVFLYTETAGPVPVCAGAQGS